MTTVCVSTARRLVSVVGTLALLGSLAMLDARPAQAEVRDTLRFALAAQGDAMYYEANSNNIPGSTQNAAGSLTARAENNSVGNSAAFAGAPYFGVTATTLPGTINGILDGQGVPFALPFTTLPAFVSSRHPGEPKASTDGGTFRISSESSEFASAASGESGAQAPAPNQQQAATAGTEAKADGTVVASATSAVKGVSAGPLTGIDVSTSATITQRPDGKPAITSSASGTFGIAGATIVFDEKGFRVAGSDVPAKQAIDTINTALANINVKLSAAPVDSRVDPVSGATVHTVGGLQLTTVQTSPGTEPVTFNYVFGRVMVSSVVVTDGGAVGAPVADDGFAGSDVAPSGDTLPEDTSALGQSAFDPPQSSGAGDGLGPAPELSDPATGGTDPAASSGGEEAPLVLGAVQNPFSAPRSESSLLYLVLVLGGLGAFVGAQVFSRFGVLLNLRESTLAGP